MKGLVENNQIQYFGLAREGYYLFTDCFDWLDPNAVYCVVEQVLGCPVIAQVLIQAPIEHIMRIFAELEKDNPNVVIDFVNQLDLAENFNIY